MASKTIFRGITLRKRSRSINGDEPTWLSAEETLMSQEVVDRVLERHPNHKREDVIDQYNDLRADSQRRRVDRLLDDWRREKNDKDYWWDLYYLRDERAYLSKGSNRKQSKALHVVLVRRLRPVKTLEIVTDRGRHFRETRSVRGSISGPHFIRRRIEKPKHVKIAANESFTLIEAPPPPDPTIGIGRRSAPYTNGRRDAGDSKRGSRSSSGASSPRQDRADLEVRADLSASKYYYEHGQRNHVRPSERGSFESSRGSDMTSMDYESMSMASDERGPTGRRNQFTHAMREPLPTRPYSQYYGLGERDHTPGDYNGYRQRDGYHVAGRTGPGISRYWEETSFRPVAAYEVAPRIRRSGRHRNEEVAYTRGILRRGSAAEPCGMDDYMTSRMENLRVSPDDRRYGARVSDDLPLPPPPQPPRGVPLYNYGAYQA